MYKRRCSIVTVTEDALFFLTYLLTYLLTSLPALIPLSAGFCARFFSVETSAIYSKLLHNMQNALSSRCNICLEILTNKQTVHNAYLQFLHVRKFRILLHLFFCKIW